jgi:mRNA interferase RelE/StbE
MYALKYRRQARNYLARLPLKLKSAIVNNLHQLAANPDNPSLDIDILKGKKGFRLRVGRYRVLYTRQDDRLILEIVKIRPRGDIYNLSRASRSNERYLWNTKPLRKMEK